MSEVSPHRRRTAPSAWYATGRDSRPPTWREIAFEIVRRALDSRAAFVRLLILLIAVAVVGTGAVVALGLLVPTYPAVGLAASTAAGGWWVRRRSSRTRA